MCHFPHKIDNFTFKSESSASVSSVLPLAPTILSSSSYYRPAVASQWDSWRRRSAVGSETDSEGEDSSDFEDGQNPYPRSRKRPSKTVNSDQDISDEEEAHHDSPRRTDHKRQRQATVSEASSLSDSQGSASGFVASASQSSGKRKESSSKSTPTRKKRKKKRSKNRHDDYGQPLSPQQPLDDQSHSSRNQRRLDNMVRTSRTSQKAASKEAHSGSESDASDVEDSTPIRKRSASKRRGQGRSLGQGGTPSSTRKRGRSQGKKKQQQEAKAKRHAAAAKRTDSDVDGNYSDGSTVSVSQGTVAHKRAKCSKAGRYFNITMGDPNDENCGMYKELYEVMFKYGYRRYKFINNEPLKKKLCEYMMDHLGIPELTLEGCSEEDRPSK